MRTVLTVVVVLFLALASPVRAITAAQIPVAESAVLIISAHPDSVTIIVRNAGEDVVYLGGSDEVDPDDGYKLAATETMTLTLAAGHTLYAICDEGDASRIDVLSNR